MLKKSCSMSLDNNDYFRTDYKNVVIQRQKKCLFLSLHNMYPQSKAGFLG